MTETTTLVDPVQTVPVDGPPKPETKKGRQMTFTQLDDGTIKADFGEGVDPLTLHPTAVPDTLAAAAMAEGIISRLRSYTSKLVDDARTPENLHSAIAKGMENLKAGIWKVEREGGAGVEYSIEVEASFLFRQMRVKAKGLDIAEAGTIDEAATAFAGLTDEQKKELKALPRYQLAYAEVKEARAAASKAKLLAKIAKEEEGDGPM